MDYNLLSIASLEDKGCKFTIEDGRFDIIDKEDDEVVLSGTRYDMSYLLDLKYSTPPHAMRSSKVPISNHASWDEWHRRLGHLHMQDVKRLANIADGINTIDADKLQRCVTSHKLCEDCVFGKQTKKHVRIPRRQDPAKRETVRGAYIHSDLGGGGKIKLTNGGHRYACILVCDATDKVWVIMLKRKSELPSSLRTFFNWMLNQGHPVRRFTSDNEIIYGCKEVQDECKEKGIQ